jgi:hypothetical protein
VEGAKLGSRCGLWVNSDEISKAMFHVTGDGEVRVKPEDIREGMVLRLDDFEATVLEAFLEDHVRERFFLIEL